MKYGVPDAPRNPLTPLFDGHIDFYSGKDTFPSVGTQQCLDMNGMQKRVEKTVIAPLFTVNHAQMDDLRFQEDVKNHQRGDIRGRRDQAVPSFHQKIDDIHDHRLLRLGSRHGVARHQ